MSDVGYATLPIIPSMRGARGVIARELNGEAGAAGDSAGREFGNRFESSSKGPLGRVGSLLGGIAKGAGIVALSALAAGSAIAGFGIKGAADLETTTTAFTSLLGSSAAATAQIKSLQAYAAKTPFQQKDVLGYAQQYFSLAGSIGLAKSQVIPFLDAIGNLGAVTGASNENIHNAVMAIGQIGSAGKITLDNLNQISEAFPGFNGAAAIAASTGQTTAQVMKQISAGSLDAKTGVQALLVGMQKFPGAAGAMEKQSQTLKGLWSTFTDTLSIQLTKAFQPVLPVLKQTLAQLTPIIGNAVKDLAPAISAFLKDLAPIIGPLIQGLGTALKAIFKALGPVFAALAPVIKPLAKAFADLVVAITPLLVLLARVVTTLGPPLLKMFSALAAALVPIVQQLVTSLGPVLPIIAQAFTRVLVALQPLLTALSGAFVQVIQAIGPQLPSLAKALADLAVAAANLLVAFTPLITAFAGIAAKLTPAFVGVTIGLAKALTAVTDAATKVVGWIVQLINIALKPLKPFLDLAVSSLKSMWSILGPLIGGIKSLKSALDGLKTVLGGLGAGLASVDGALDVLGGKTLQAGGGIIGFNTALGNTKQIAPGTATGLLGVAGAAVGLGGVLTIAAAGADAVTESLYRMAAQAAVAAAALIPIVGPALALAGAALAIPKAAKAAASIPKITLGSGGGAGGSAASSLPAFDQGTLTSFLSTVGITSNPLTDALNAIFKSAAAAGKRIGAPLANALRAENSELKGLVAQRASIAHQLEAAQAKLTAAREAYANEKSTVKSAVTGTFDLGTMSSPYGEPVTLFDIQGALATAVRNARRFTSVLKRLAKEGLAKGLLQQLAMAGPGALTQAEALLTATPKQLAQINSSYKALGDQGTALGKFMADDLYGAGVNAAEGLVKGLQSKQSALTRAIKSLAEAMVAQLRRSLDMHSPSRRLFNEGALAFEGYRLGIESKGREIEKDLANLGNRLMPDSKVQASHRAGESAAHAGQVIHLTQNIQNPIPEAPSRTTPASIRRAAYALGK